MIFRNKYHTTRVTQFVSVLLTLVAIEKIIGAGLSGASLVWPALFLSGTVSVGVTASLLSYYYRARQDDSTRSQKVAVETLARLGRKKK
jgi:hypothetical protein